MASKLKNKARRFTGQFAALPHTVLKNKDYIGLSNKSKALLVELALQYNGSNNGDLTVAFAVLRGRGWKRKATISAAVKELLASDLITRTREGQFQNPFARCSLYAINWNGIDECKSKDLNVRSTATPPRKFSMEKSQ
jgi:hypothetical protein